MYSDSLGLGVEIATHEADDLTHILVHMLRDLLAVLGRHLLPRSLDGLANLARGGRALIFGAANILHFVGAAAVGVGSLRHMATTKQRGWDRCYERLASWTSLFKDKPKFNHVQEKVYGLGARHGIFKPREAHLPTEAARWVPEAKRKRNNVLKQRVVSSGF